MTAIQKVKPGREAEIEELMATLTRQVRANEPGNLGFDYVRASGQERTYLVIERYLDQAALHYHQGTPYLRAFLPKLMDCLEAAPQVQTYSDALPQVPSEPPPYFHIGTVVPDLEKAMARYTDVLGIRFAEPATFHVPRLEDPDPHPADIVCAMSMTRPPYHELIQSAGSGVISAANSGRILYFGYWEPDMAGRLEHLRAAGIAMDALFRMDASSAPFAMITAPDLFGTRIEYVDAKDRGPIEEWVRTGHYPGGIGG